jgi:hypothetical protein
MNSSFFFCSLLFFSFLFLILSFPRKEDPSSPKLDLEISKIWSIVHCSLTFSPFFNLIKILIIISKFLIIASFYENRYILIQWYFRSNIIYNLFFVKEIILLNRVIIVELFIKKIIIAEFA